MGLLEDKRLYFDLDGLLEEDGFDIEELYFFWKIFFVVYFELIGSLFIEIGLSGIGVDDDL